jgi:hypothetical protein
MTGLLEGLWTQRAFESSDVQMHIFLMPDQTAWFDLLACGAALLAIFQDEWASEIFWFGIFCRHTSIDDVFVLGDISSVVFAETYVNTTFGPGTLFGEDDRRKFLDSGTHHENMSWS